jgi:hypothetical protein
MVTVRLDLSELSDELEGATQEVLRDVASELVNRLKDEAPVGATGDLQRLTQIYQEQPGRVIITMPEHARFVQEATDPPAAGRSIPFGPIELWTRRKLGGDEDTAWAVWQKLMTEGTDADPFVTRALEQTKRQFQG